MSNLEAELARFEAELAAVETTHHHEQPAATDAQHYYSAHQPAADPSVSMPPVSHQPASMPPAPYTHTQPMYHQYQAPVHPPPHMPPPSMMPPAPGYALPHQQMYGEPPPQAYYPTAIPGMAPVDMYSLAPTMTGTTLTAAAVITAPPVESQEEDPAAAHTGTQAASIPSKGKSVKRHAAGQTWWDPTLAEWPDNDFRVFVGDLGNEVNDDVLTKAFQKYPTFARAKVVRDRRSNKSKGFGFVSFLESGDYAKALREMDGQYIGNRPCKLRKSSWTERNAFSQKRNKKQKT